MLTAETLNAFLDQMIDHEPTEPFTFAMSPLMHKRIFMLAGMGVLSADPRYKLRRVHMRRLIARRKDRRKRLERAYNTRYSYFEREQIDDTR